MIQEIKNSLPIEDLLDLATDTRLMYYSRQKNLLGRQSLRVELSSIKKGPRGFIIMLTAIQGNFNVIAEAEDYGKEWVLTRIS